MEYFDIDTGEITAVDKIFHGYNPDYILSCNPDDLANNIMGFALGNKSVGAQMRALVFDNVPKLLKFEKSTAVLIITTIHLLKRILPSKALLVILLTVRVKIR